MNSLDRPTGREHGLWSDCIRQRSKRHFKTKTIGDVPPPLFRHFQTIKDHTVGNHVLQVPKTTWPNRGDDIDCGCMVRYGCGCPLPSDADECGEVDATEARILRPKQVAAAVRANCITDTKRLTDLIWRTNDWCSIKRSGCCPRAAAAAAAAIDGECCPVLGSECCSVAAASALGRPLLHRPRTTAIRTSNSRLYAERVYNVDVWHNWLLDELAKTEEQSRRLQELTWQLENALQGSDIPLGINKLSINAHQKRMDVDYDETMEALCQEREVLFKCREKMDNLLDDAHQQILRNCEMGQALTFDLSTAHQTKAVDTKQYPLRFNSTRVGFHPGIAETNDSVLRPEIWLRGVRETVRKSEEMRRRSTDICDRIERYLRACLNEMWHRANVVNNSFNARVNNIHEERTTAAAKLKQVTFDLVEGKRNLLLNEQLIEKKEKAKEEADEQMKQRDNLEVVDVCYKSFYNRSTREVKEMCRHLNVLNGQREKTKKKIASLEEEKTALEQRIDVIDHDLVLDTQESMPVRENLIINTKGGPLTWMPY